MLLICLTSVRLSIAVTASIREWLDGKELALLSTGYKESLRNIGTEKRGLKNDSVTNNSTDFTDPAKESTSQTGCLKATEVQKRCMSDSTLLASNS